jgi:sugar phosphate permease
MAHGRGRHREIALPLTPSLETAPAAASLARRSKVWRWRVYAATWLSYFGFYFCRKPFSIVKSDLGKALHFDTGTLGDLSAGFSVAYMAGQFLSGWIGPRFGPRAMLLCGMGVSIAASVGLGGAHLLFVFAFLLVVNGIAQATGWPNNVATMASWTPKGERGTVMGVWATNYQAGGIAANAVAAWTLGHIGFRQSFLTGALVLAAVVVFFWFNQANRPEDKGLAPLVDDDQPGAVSNGPAGEVRWSGRTWALVLLIGGAYFGMKFIRYALWSWAPFVLSRNFGLKGDDAGYVSTIFDVCGMAGVVALGWASDRLFHGHHALASFVMILGLVAATVVALTLGTHSVGVFAACIGLIGFTLFGPDALMTGAGVMDLVGKGTVRASGIIGGLGAAGQVLQDLLIGHSGAQVGPMLAMLIGSATLTAACLAAFIVVARRPAGLQA